ncbi:pleiotropic drug resistance protein ABC superfamily [Phytophthora sojae]|uniref:Pleiotropic drug resistance protein ABC superfamily n=1 Tax=Phytophthora sojae (strain P6497) TaxID=1094619 RepID=G5A4P6_PHYSP|nr:pleiotropic drug resistance protein ABC superfamily [Phytophthora sojae]EGZ09646.1 pleiotropic drug resistance protein ABC superfamily [Phytophthora sojae]|eukprot:XP_009534507.1 pleiotropic drug resistance protein ABC superfamily [Phytophthora sojae]
MEKKLGYDSGAALMAEGAEVLHQHLASKVETSLGSAIPQMDVRFSNLSVTADIVVVDDSGSKYELPTIPNTLKKAFVGPKKRVVRKEVLKDISGAFRPSRIALLLGQPGSGKSSLLKMLSGRFSVEKNITVEGDITFNNVKREQVIQRLPQFVSYVNQRDKHYPMLTVKETLEFADKFCGSSLSKHNEQMLTQGSDKENADALSIVKAVFAHYPDVVLQQLGLKNCQDTIVGDAMTRGISGGERKRVTTGEMEFGTKFVSLMDEISTGLDSAATYDIINTQRSIAHTLHKNVVIALLQPSPEVFSLFDDVMILNEGQLMYHGPCSEVERYFEDLGFSCPPGRDIADYLLDLGTSEQYRCQEMLRTLEAPPDPELLRCATQSMDPTPTFNQSFIESTLTLLRRQLLVTYRNKPFILGGLLMITVMGLLYCTVFYDFDPTEVSVVLGVVFSSVMFVSMGQSSQIATYMAEREIFYKQRGANFFRTGSYTIIFGSLVYWLCGFESDISLYLIFELVLFLTNLAMGMWFFFLCSIGPNANIVTPLSVCSVLVFVVFVVFAGFIGAWILEPSPNGNLCFSKEIRVLSKSTRKFPDYLIFAHWLSPMSWSVKALSINQYRSDAMDVCKYWVAYGIVYSAAIYVVFMFLSCLGLEYLRYETPENVDVSEKPVDDESYALMNTPKNTNSGGSYAMEVESQEKSFVPVTMAFQDLHYFVPDPHNPKDSLELLKGINGFAVPASITALMGSSGAGKTTLMDVIAGRKTGGKITGKILLNGYEANDLAIRRCTGYCEQMDVHSEAATIREALTFSSFLRQDASIPDAKKYESVDECIELLGLEDIADQIIRGSSVEQMKRLTIGVELAAQPSVIFLDEPTSGLDARSAKLVMDGVRKVADSGRTIICTIHQPSAEVFYLFDSLLLLKRGGEIVFFGELGENCCNLINYFLSIPGVAPLPLGYNPATWMLECIGAGVSNSAAGSMDFVNFFNSSALSRALKNNMAKEGITTPSPDLPEMVFAEKRAANSITQMKFVLHPHAHDPLAVFFALLFGVVSIDADYASYSGLNSGVGMVYMAALFQAIMTFQSVLPLACSERASYYRERANQSFNALWYFVGSTIVEIPYCLCSGFLFTVVFYPMSAGLSIPSGYDWMYKISPLWFPLSIMEALVFADCDELPTWNESTQAYENVGSKFGCQPMENSPVTVGHITIKEYTEQYFGFKHESITHFFFFIIGCIVLFRVVGLIALRFLNHQKR